MSHPTAMPSERNSHDHRLREFVFRNYSQKPLAWQLCTKLDPTTTYRVLDGYVGADLIEARQRRRRLGHR